MLGSLCACAGTGCDLTAPLFTALCCPTVILLILTSICSTARLCKSLSLLLLLSAFFFPSEFGAREYGRVPRCELAGDRDDAAYADACVPEECMTEGTALCVRERRMCTPNVRDVVGMHHKSNNGDTVVCMCNSAWNLVDIPFSAKRMPSQCVTDVAKGSHSTMGTTEPKCTFRYVPHPHTGSALPHGSPTVPNRSLRF